MGRHKRGGEEQELEEAFLSSFSSSGFAGAPLLSPSPQDSHRDSPLPIHCPARAWREMSQHAKTARTGRKNLYSVGNPEKPLAQRKCHILRTHGDYGNLIDRESAFLHSLPTPAPEVNPEFAGQTEAGKVSSIPERASHAP